MKERLTALATPEVKNDGTGSSKVMLQVPKSAADDACTTVRVRFRVTEDKIQPAVLDAELLREE